MRKLELPILFAKTRDSAKQWSISVNESKEFTEIITKYGLKGGKSKLAIEKIEKDEKGGKKKFKSHFEVAEDIANTKFNKKIKEGYAQSIIESEILNKENKIRSKRKLKKNSDEEDFKELVDEIENLKDEDFDIKKVGKKSKFDTHNESIHLSNISPMLACDYNKHSSYITFPCYVQPKLDGVRAIFYKNKLFSRNGNTFPNLEHIKTELKSVDLVLDGELYTKEVKFEELVGLVKRQSLSDEQAINCLNIKYFVYDYISNTENNKTRISKLTNFFKENKFNYIEFVITEVCNRKEDVQSFHDKFVKFGYEGVMLRNFNGLYAVNSRSKDLQKYKMFLDDEFKIVDYTCGSGKEEGCVIWICKTESGKQFNARPEGNYSQRKELYKNARKFIGKMLTVRYQNLTQDGIPRFPVGITIRDYE